MKHSLHAWVLTFSVLTNEGLRISRGTLFTFFQINKVWRCLDRIRKSDIIFIAYYAGWTGVSGSCMHFLVKLIDSCRSDGSRKIVMIEIRLFEALIKQP